MKHVAVLPFVLRDWADDCVASMSEEFKDGLLLVDNTHTNLGVMASHNLGVDRVLETQADWLIVVSAAVRFGEPGGSDFLQALRDHVGHHVVESQKVFGWHLIAFSRETLERVGKWDENYSPYGFDDLDYAIRIRLAYELTPPFWAKVPVEATDMGMGHSIKIAEVEAPAEPRLTYFCKKWGVELAEDGGKSQPRFTHPFDDPSHDFTWWPVPPDPRSILGDHR